MKYTQNNKLSHGVKKTAVASVIALSFSGNVQAIETFLKADFQNNCSNVDAGVYTSYFGGYHTGNDYECRNTNNRLETISFGKIAFKYEMTVKPNCGARGTKNECSGQPDHGMGNVLEITHLLSTGEEVTSSYNHLSKFNNLSLKDKYVTQKQVVAYVGGSGQSCSNYWELPHLHFEMKTKPRSALIAPWGYSGTKNSPKEPVNYGFLKPNDYLNIKEIALPILSKTKNPNRTINYDVFGITNQPIYGYLNLNGKFTQSGIIARRFSSGGTSRKRITEPGDLQSNALTSPKFLGGTNDNLSVNGITTSVPVNYNAGDYLFATYVKQGSDARYGYPVKFTFVPEGSVIVDNDQKNAGQVVKTEPAYTYAGSQGEKVPGYFLTAELHKRRSGDSVRWTPNKAGKYKIYVHIPEYGATATNVKYSIKADGSTNVMSKPVNQNDNKDKWVQIFDEAGRDNFDFNENGYLGLGLFGDLNSANYGTNDTDKIAFDAVKFECVSSCGETASSVSTTAPVISPVVTNETFPTDGYTKIANDGSKLPDSAKLGTAPKEWACTRDNKTGLIWEVKNTDGGLRDWKNKYTWYEPDANKNGGFAGYQNGDNNSTICKGSDCDTFAYTNAVNKQSLCGASDWRLPNIDELKDLLTISSTTNQPLNDLLYIDSTYFPNTRASLWSSSTHTSYNDHALDISFSWGTYGDGGKDYYRYVRLVRGGQ